MKANDIGDVLSVICHDDKNLSPTNKGGLLESSQRVTAVLL